MSDPMDSPTVSEGPRQVSGQIAPGRRPGGTDVARLAGVSQKTVSRVMNGEVHVSEEVRLRVLAAARELGYRRNNQARALNSGRTTRIGVVSLGTALYGPSSSLVAIERTARSTGYGLSIVNTFEGDAGGVSGAIDSLLEEGVDGIVLSEPIDEGSAPITLDVPVLTMGPFPGLTAPSIINAGGPGDNAGHTATRHLITLGHRQVRHLAGPMRWWSARDRADGWSRALREADLPQVAFIEGDWSPASGYRAGRLLATDLDMTAVFVANDDMAIGLIRALTEAGRRVPDDVSVIGFDDIPSAAYLHPPLTTVAGEFTSTAIRGLRRLIARIENPDAALISDDPADPVKLIMRESTAPIRATEAADTPQRRRRPAQ